MRTRLPLLAALAASALLVACGSDSEVKAGSGGKGLEGVQWQLDPSTTLGVPLGDSPITASFDGGTLSGFGGCNNYTTTYTLKGNDLTVAAPIASTQRACEAKVMAAEQAYLTVLAQTAGYKVSDGQLTLSKDGGDSTLVYTQVTADALNGSWVATSYRTATAVTSVVGGVELTLVIDGDQASGSGGCNNFNGPIKVDGTSVKIGPLAATARACEQEISDQEQAYFAALQEATTFKITGDQLDLLMADGTFAATFTKG